MVEDEDMLLKLRKRQAQTHKFEVRNIYIYEASKHITRTLQGKLFELSSEGPDSSGSAVPACWGVGALDCNLAHVRIYT